MDLIFTSSTNTASVYAWNTPRPNIRDCAGTDCQGGEITTAECLKSIRRALPGAEIILSTWEREVVDGLDYDVLVQSPDPGGQPRPDGLMHNINRQIVSTLNGLQQASKIYAVKMRTNSLLENPKFLEQYDKRPLNPQYPKLFRNWVVSTELYSRNPAKTDCIRLFLPSDIFFFGLRRDLLNLWDIPLHPDQYVTSRWRTGDTAPNNGYGCRFYGKRAGAPTFTGTTSLL